MSELRLLLDPNPRRAGVGVLYLPEAVEPTGCLGNCQCRPEWGGLLSSSCISALFEDWTSEFLQEPASVTLTAFPARVS